MWQWNIFHISKSLLESFEWDEINYQVAIQMTILWPNKEKFIKDLNIKIFFFWTETQYGWEYAFRYFWLIMQNYFVFCFIGNLQHC